MKMHRIGIWKRQWILSHYWSEENLSSEDTHHFDVEIRMPRPDLGHFSYFPPFLFDICFKRIARNSFKHFHNGCDRYPNILTVIWTGMGISLAALLLWRRSHAQVDRICSTIKFNGQSIFDSNFQGQTGDNQVKSEHFKDNRTVRLKFNGSRYHTFIHLQSQ
jgi:hypothetical protein